MRGLRHVKNQLAVLPEPFDTIHPELVEGMNGAQDRRVEGRMANCDTVSKRGGDFKTKKAYHLFVWRFGLVYSRVLINIDPS